MPPKSPALITDHAFWPVAKKEGGGYWPNFDRCFTCGTPIEAHERHGIERVHPNAYNAGCRDLNCIQLHKAEIKANAASARQRKIC